MVTTPRGAQGFTTEGNGMRRLVGRDVLGAPRAGNARAARTGTSMLRAWGRPGDAGRRGRRPLPQMSPWPPCARAAPGGSGMHRLVGRDVLGAPRAGNVHPARTGTPIPRARGRSGDAGRRGRRPLPCDIKPTAWLFQKFPCIRRTPYRGNIQRESHPLPSDILTFYRCGNELGWFSPV